MASPENELIVTGDGSHSFNSRRFNVPYHSFHGAIQESKHVFMEAGLEFVHETAGYQEIRVLEMGFGTGLNAALLLSYAKAHPEATFHYCGVEKYPLPLNKVEALNYPGELGLDAELFMSLHRAPDNAEPYPITPNFNYSKSSEDFLEGLPREWQPGSFHLLFYDAFAPASQPELWKPAALDICYEALAKGGVFVTYCAKGQFKRDLKSVGFTVEPLPGPPGKREMTRGIKR